MAAQSKPKDTAPNPAPTDGPALLGVAQSFAGQYWSLARAPDRDILAIAQRLDVPEIMARVLVNRGVDLEDAETFLNPTLRDSLPDPSSFIDMDAACDRLASAIAAGEPIEIFGDYDVDGATSAALLTRYFNAVGGKSRVYIPDRIKEGYGPNGPAMRQIAERGAKVVVTVDCGTTAVVALGEAQEAGLDVIVVDHHQADVALPPSCALVNPNRQDEDEETRTNYGNLAAVGVAFMVVVGLNRTLRDRGWFEGDRKQPNPLAWLDLVALGTVCDVVPLTGLNRAFVSQGLKVMARRANVGLRALSDVGGITEAPGAYHAGFVLGPRVNAGGRVGRSDMGAQLLTTEDPNLARQLATELDLFNDQRKDIERDVQEGVMVKMASLDRTAPVLVVSGDGWHPGVIGIVASRIKDKYRKPVFVIANDGGLGKGSGRSVPGVDLGAAVTAAHQAGLLENGGGHKMAAGLTIKTENIDALRQFFAKHLASGNVGDNVTPGLTIDGVLAVGGATTDLVDLLEQAGPYGSAHREPRFAFAESILVKADIVGDNHVSCILSSKGGGRLKAIAFRAMDNEIGPALLSAHKAGKKLHIAGHLRADNWMGRSQAQLFIDDVAPAN
jgi:single-stranded-DNA-specific exonuclease